jgi:hypothetical protein
MADLRLLRFSFLFTTHPQPLPLADIYIFFFCFFRSALFVSHQPNLHGVQDFSKRNESQWLLMTGRMT